MVHNHVTTCTTLLEKKADPAPADERGRSPLHMAALHASRALVMVLLSHGAPVGAPDGKGRTALHYATDRGSSAVVTAILNTPAGRVCANQQDRKGRSALHCAAQLGDLAVVKLLLQYGCDMNLEEGKGFTPLDVARYFGNTAVAQLLALRGGIANKTVPGLLVDDEHGHSGWGDADVGAGGNAAEEQAEGGGGGKRWSADVEAGKVWWVREGVGG